MGLKEDLNERIERKAQEIRELEAQIREANAYIQGLRDVIEVLPREDKDKKAVRKTKFVLRPNTDLSKVREYLLEVGGPVHVSKILEGIGKGDTKANRLSLTGTLGDYVRRREIFDRPAPNTFGLIELPSAVKEGTTQDEINSQEKVLVEANEPPDDFGLPVSDEAEDPFD